MSETELKALKEVVLLTHLRSEVDLFFKELASLAEESGYLPSGEPTYSEGPEVHRSSWLQQLFEDPVLHTRVSIRVHCLGLPANDPGQSDRILMYLETGAPRNSSADMVRPAASHMLLTTQAARFLGPLEELKSEIKPRLNKDLMPELFVEITDQLCP